MPDFDLKIELEKKKLTKVKQTTPVLKKFIVSLINKTGRMLFLLRKNSLPERVNKILFVSLYFNGDILFHSAFFELTKKLYPDAEFHIWIKSRTGSMMSGYPYMKKVFVFDDVRTRRYDEKVSMNLMSKLSFVKQLKKEKYDLAYDLTGLFWSAFIIWRARIKYSSGFNFQGFGFLYSNETESIYKGHLVDKHLNLILKDRNFEINTIDIVSETVKLNYQITEDSRKSVDKLFETLKIPDGKKRIVFHTTAGWDAKTWDVQNYAKLARALKEMYLIIIIGSGNDVENGRIISEMTGNEVIDLTNRLNINESAEVIRRAVLFIGADSGPLYLAESVGVRTLSLFGPTNPLFSAPRGSKHRYIYKELFCSAEKDVQNCKLLAGLNCRTVDCMKMITPEEVKETIEVILGPNEE